MPYSRVNFTYTGGAQVFPTNFALGVLEADHIKVTVDGQLDGLGNLKEFAHTYDIGSGEVTVTEPLTIGWAGEITRTVPLDSLIVDFEANADVTRRNLARSTRQVLMAVQEAADARAQDSADVAEVKEIVEDLQDTIAEDVATVTAAVVAAELAATEAEAANTAAQAKQNSILFPRGAWATGQVYALANIVQFGGSSYECIIAHTAGVFATDLSATRWRVFAAKGDAGPGSGDMLKTENLSGLTNVGLARTNLGLLALATKNTVAFADVDPTWIVSDVETLVANKVANAVPVAKAVTDYIDPHMPRVLATRVVAGVSVADMVFTEFDNAKYSRYMLALEHVLPTANSTALRAQLSSNGGASWISGPTSYGFHNEDHTAAGHASGDSGGGQPYLEIIRAAVWNAGPQGGVAADMHFINAGNPTELTAMHGTGGYVTNSPQVATFRAYGYEVTPSVTNALRLFFSSGNIAVGSKVRLIGFP